MNLSELEEVKDRLRSTGPQLEALAAHFDAQTMRRKPEDREFSPLEHLCHLRDIERDGYCVRIQQLLSEREPYLRDLDGEQLARERAYNQDDPRTALDAFIQARSKTLELLQNVSVAQLSQIGRFENVGQVTLAELLHMLCAHDAEHLGTLQALRP